MVTKLNSYILSDNIIDKMKTKIEETREKKIELGFGLCRIKHIDTLKIGKECTGDLCTLKHITTCPVGLYIGGYHTHPRGTARPSITDLKSAYVNDVECIGSVTENVIRCFIRAGHRNPENEKKIVAILKEVEEPLPKVVSKEEYEKWQNARDETLDKYFKVVEVK